ncbi:serine hydrolase domain-containing protein [Bacillus suaedaesalsae]|uniref:Beta-lactamase family protein n=1 Tax=Bacillus suaedaesalsae TaxID=2810349 RepID=A0ABS2DG00_9BACI|nr:serine hydrolase domain-containing protein [Bacillus suaedaesalsae]MBM6617404.1 beta-lactamase family protein [Bacillus suaedaesalsae]
MKNLIEQFLVKELSCHLQPIYTYVESVRHQISASAAAVYVIQHDKIIGEWYSGFHSLSSEQKVQEDSRFNVYSTRKSYIGLATSIAVYEGKIKEIDDLVLDYLDEERVLLEGTTIRHLVTHTHGLDIKDGKLVRQFSPGEGWDYNNAGLSLLYKIILQTTSRTVNEILQENVFKPLQLQETGWESTEQANLVCDVLEPTNEARLSLDDNSGFERNLYVSARELAHFGYCHLKRGEIGGKQMVPSALFDMTTAVQTPIALQNTPQNGFFWFRNVNNFAQSEIGGNVPKGAYQILGASGCTVLVIPEYEAVAVRMYNKRGNPPGYDYLQDIKQFGNLVSSLLQESNQSTEVK